MKKTVSLFLAVVMLCSMCITGYAADENMSNFKNINTYSNNFTDVASSNWAAGSIIACYEFGIMYGSSDTKFNPSGNLTVAEAIVMAVRVHSIYNSGKTAVLSGSPWYSPYIDYATENGLITQSDFLNYDAKITRSQMAYLFYNALPENEFDTKNTIAGIPDVTVSSLYYHEILGLYEAGILTGSDSRGSFYPSNNITRAESAAIISRVVDKSLRKEFSLDSSDVSDLTANQISANCSPAVGFVQNYNSQGILISTGSGFFIDKDGTFVTNYHVIKDAVMATVTLPDGNTYIVAGVYDFDSARDTALLKVNGENFSYLEMDNGELMAGDTIYVIGSPRGLSNTISSGLISNVSREINGQDYIQFTAPISSGSSGGALINGNGKVIGITSAILMESDTSITQNINFAIPISYIQSLEKKAVTDLSVYNNPAESELTLTVNPKSMTLAVDETKIAYVNFSAGYGDYLYVSTDDTTVAEVNWNDDSSTSTSSASIKGISAGSTTIRFYYKIDGQYFATTSITVTVTGYSSNTNNNSIIYYKNGAPSYQSVTGYHCISTYFSNTDNTSSGYYSNGTIFTYDYNYDALAHYLNVLEGNGWTCYDSEKDDSSVTFYYTKGYEMIGVKVALNYNEVWINVG